MTSPAFVSVEMYLTPCCTMKDDGISAAFRLDSFFLMTTCTALPASFFMFRGPSVKNLRVIPQWSERETTAVLPCGALLKSSLLYSTRRFMISLCPF